MKETLFNGKSALITGMILLVVSGNVFARSLLWRDEFEGTSLDTTKWLVVNAEDWYDCWYAPHNVEVSDGTLKLHSQEQSFYGKHWTGAKLESKYYPRYKYLEARVRHSLPDAHIWSAWWTVGWTGSTWHWPPEFDIFEFMKVWQSSPFQTYHWTPDNWDIVPPTGLDETEWHTYGVYWTESETPFFYVDGVPTYQSSGSDQVAQMAALLLLSSSPNRDDHYSGCPLGYFEVDYVRVYDTPPDLYIRPNLALNKPVEVSSVQDGHPGSLAVDGDSGTRWASDWSDPQFIIIDFEQNLDFDIISLSWEAAYASKFLIQVSSDKVNWITLIDEQDGVGGTQEYSVDANGRYLKILGTERGTGYGYSLYEVEVYQSQCGRYDLAAVSAMSRYWLETNCSANNQCEGADMDFDNDVDLIDLEELALQWLNPNCSGNS